MRRQNKWFQKDDGIALLMVLTSITILTFLLAEFTFDTNLNKIKVQNKMDILQARLNAEAGVNFALAKLRIYQKGYNLLEKRKEIRDVFGPDKLEASIKTPFIYPIPIGGDLNIIQKTALQEMDKNMLIRGGLQLSLDSVSGFINPNNLSLHKKLNTKSPKKNEEEDFSNYEENDETNKTFSQLTQEILIETLETSMQEEKEKSETFEALYGDLEADLLIKELTYYVSDPREMDEADRALVDSKFIESGVFPKHAPLSSISELYLLPSWKDAIVDLLKERISVYQVGVIHLNEINSQQLKVIFPQINKDQIKEFFKYRDGDPGEKIEPSPFKNEAEFKSVIVSNLGVVGSEQYDDRVRRLKASGLSIGIASKLFRVTSTGIYGNAKYTVEAIIDLPFKPLPPPKKKKDKNKDGEAKGDEPPEKSKDELTDSKKEEKPVPRELMLPRVVNITVI
ncbi:MAG: hypothetical protein ACO20H_07980 [Bacteriovoracaceae bacterium]